MASVTIWIARFLLAAVFAVAGIGKLLDFEKSRKSVIAFGLRASWAGPFTRLLPVVELACAGALLFSRSAQWGAVGMAALLALFIVAIGVNLAKGRTPECNCFGQLGSGPVSAKTLARNAVLLCLAALVALFPATGLPLVLSRFTSFEAAILGSLFALAAVLLLILWFLLHIVRQNGRLLLRLEAMEHKVGLDPVADPAQGLNVGQPAPAFQLTALDGRTVRAESLTGPGAKPLLLLFSQPGCSACEDLYPEIAQWQRDHGGRLTIVPVSSGSLDANLKHAAQYGLQNVTLEALGEISKAFQSTATPSAVLVADGLIASPLASGPDAIRRLVGGLVLPPSVKKGELVPALPLKDLDGKLADLASMGGMRRLILFWSPVCGFCLDMLEDIKRWERNRPPGAPDLVVISSGTAEGNREQGFRSPVLLDPIFGAGKVLGAGGTPSAVIIDENGRVDSEVAVGAPAVLTLAGVRR